ncbi:MAG: hypothetical protein IRZ14_14975 [Chloroflexi bacterium]|nr:hypothetical protein [Chloroflexota bacterium]
MNEQRALDEEFAIVELEPREAPAPDAMHCCGSGGLGSGSVGSGAVVVGSGGSGT